MKVLCHYLAGRKNVSRRNKACTGNDLASFALVQGSPNAGAPSFLDQLT
jgi:hypothetical protein